MPHERPVKPERTLATGATLAPATAISYRLRHRLFTVFKLESEKTVRVTSLTARIQPASRSARSVLTDVQASLRQLDHVRVSAHENLTEWPGVGRLLVTELPGALVLHLASAQSANPSSVRAAISQQIRQAAGSRSAAAKLVVTWTESTSHLSALTM